ncbi:MAG: ATP-binding cassette domain-containing protein [Candidatus Nanopelagicales bacterium]
MDTTTVDLRHVTKTFRGTTALRSINLRMQPGVVGLLGPNGAGKTTLLRILATVLAVDNGSVRVLGRDVTDTEQRTDIRRRLGYLPQELGFPRGFSAYAFVDYMAVLKEWDDAAARRTEVRRALAAVGLQDKATKRIRALSGGQRRRVALAQALLGSPELLVLDEPTTGLDPEQRVSLRQVLAEAGRTATVVISTHQTDDVAALCDRVVVLDEGSVRFDGRVQDLVNEAAGRVWLADRADPRASASWRTGTGRYRNLGQTAPPDAELVEPSLEDAYLLLRGASAPDDAEVAA